MGMASTSTSRHLRASLRGFSLTNDLPCDPFVKCRLRYATAPADLDGPEPTVGDQFVDRRPSDGQSRRNILHRQ